MADGSLTARRGPISETDSQLTCLMPENCLVFRIGENRIVFRAGLPPPSSISSFLTLPTPVLMFMALLRRASITAAVGDRWWRACVASVRRTLASRRDARSLMRHVRQHCLVAAWMGFRICS